MPMVFLFFLVSFNYHILKILKDPLIITAPNSGAETIPFLKVWAILPSSILLTLIFTKLSSKFNRETIFYVMIGIFLTFFVIFIFFLYPNTNFFTLDSISNKLSATLPKGFKGFISMVRYWHFSLYYIVAEAWSTIMLSLLLWVFIVDVLTLNEAKRYYSLFGTSRNLAGIVSGFLVNYIAGKTISNKLIISLANTLNLKSAWDQTMLLFIITVIISSLIIIGIYRYLHIYIYPQRYLMGGDQQNKGKQKISFKKSLSYATNSKYILYIALMVLSYNILTNLTEVLWKSQIHELYPSPSDYASYVSKTTYFTGILASICAFFISGNLIRRLGWKTTALITPAAIMITGLGFFYFLFFKKYSEFSHQSLTFFNFSPLILTVFFGALQDVLSRALKYTIFDDTKEMTFIPLSAEEKLKGKSVIDGIGSRLGKSSASLIMQILFIFFATPMGASPYIFGIILLTLPIWIKAINKLSKEFEAKTTSSSEELEAL